MTIALIRTPYEPVLGLNAQGLTGHWYIGLETLDPEDYPKAVYWDAAGAQPAEQPIDVQGGYPMRDGTPAKLYTDGRFSIRARSMAGVQIWFSDSEGPDDTAPGQGAFECSFYFVDPAVDGDILYAYSFVRDVTFPDDFAGSEGGSESADAETTCSVTVNGVEVGALVYAVDGTVTQSTTAGAVSVVAGDVLRVVAATANALTGSRFTFKGAIVA